MTTKREKVYLNRHSSDLNCKWLPMRAAAGEVTRQTAKFLS